MTKSPPCSQYEPPAHSLVTRKTGTTFCRKKPVRKAKSPAKSPVKKALPVKKVRKTRSNKGAVRGGARGGLGAMVKKHPVNKPVAPKSKTKKTNDPNKGKFLVSMKFNLLNSRNLNNLNNAKRWNGKPLYSEDNKKILRNAKPPSNKEFSNYMGKMNNYNKIPLYEAYLKNLYSYGNYDNTPKVKNYKNRTVRYVINSSKKREFNNKIIFPTSKSIKNHLNLQSVITTPG